MHIPRSITQTLFLLSTLVLCLACEGKLTGSFAPNAVPVAPDYSQEASWAALPFTEDAADRTPGTLTDAQAEAPVDVFFVYPTLYFNEKEDTQWNAPVNDSSFNARVDNSSIQYQASVFNGVGQIYAPRYRQAHLQAYFHKDTVSSKQAFDLAYADVLGAFEYYMEHYNDGRPFIIASHSQGTTHTRRLIREEIELDPVMREQMVVAYLIGIPVLKEHFTQVDVCESPTETNCFCTWRTWKEGKLPKKWTSETIAVTNPLSWTTDPKWVAASQNRGAVLRDFNEIVPQICDARVNAESGVLWVHKPAIPGAAFLRGNYHIADFNLFYLNIRENAAERVAAYFATKSGS